MAGGCAYETQLREASRLISERVGASSWALTFQSRSGPPAQPWLEPDVCDYIRSFHETDAARADTAARADAARADTAARADSATRDIVLIPAGFISDHMEVAYDLDVEARACCDELGVRMVRAETAGTHPRFVDMIVELVEERLSASTDRPAAGALEPWPDHCSLDCCPSGR
jgi:ferrochelatase